MESSSILDQLLAGFDATTITAAVASIGVVIIGIKFGEKAIPVVKRLIGKI